MNRDGGRSPLAELDRLAELAELLAGAWGARAQGTTSVGQERALLRLFGVLGLDRAGRPLAGQSVDRYVMGHPERLASGVALPFAMALLEYDLAPQELALDVASGAVDLALEAELLAVPDRRASAEAEARRLMDAAIERIDANRTARHELIDLLDDAPRPWLGATLSATADDQAIPEAEQLARDGVDVVRVEVPVGRELATRLQNVGVEVHPWHPRRPGGGAAVEIADGRELAPSGSQRGLARLREALDEAAAERRRYVRISTAAPGLYAPEQAVVAAFERVDMVEADVMAEIVSGRIHPDRALADHAFAHRIHGRAGSLVVIDAGPLVVAPDLASGIPSDPATRAGRALALQAVAVALARADGLRPEQVVIGALPRWIAEERLPAARAAAEVAVRRALFPGHPAAFREPSLDGEQEAAWPFIVAGVMPPPPATALIILRPGAPQSAKLRALRAAGAVSGELAGAIVRGDPEGAAAEHARATIAAAITTLRRLGDVGWRAILGDGPESDRWRLGADAVAERSDAFDPLAVALVPAR